MNSDTKFVDLSDLLKRDDHELDYTPACKACEDRGYLGIFSDLLARTLNLEYCACMVAGSGPQ